MDTDSISLYSIALQIVVYSRIPAIISNFRIRTAYLISLCSVYFLVLFIWLFYANSSSAWIPYKINTLKLTFPTGYYYGDLI